MSGPHDTPPLEPPRCVAATAHDSAPLRLDIAAIKRAHALLDVLVARRVPLVPAGMGNYRALCPFHDDQQPSLFVDARDQHYHCFSCGAHGDVLDYLRRTDGVSLREAAARLASIPPASSLHRPSLTGQPPPRRWDRLTVRQQEVMRRAATLWEAALWRAPRVLAYLRGRGVPDHVTRACGLGWSSGQTLEPLTRDPDDCRIAAALGLLHAPLRPTATTPWREHLGGRIVIPERRGGLPIWFIGRWLGDGSREWGLGSRQPDRPAARAGAHDATSRPLDPQLPIPNSHLPFPKYLALGGERPLLGWERVVGQAEVYLCEGVFDWLTAVSWGLAACSPCGVAVPDDRLGVLAGARVVYGVLDGDAAGRAAHVRFGAQLGARWRPLRLPDGCDLNDLGSRPGGRELFVQLVDDSHTHQQEER